MRRIYYQKTNKAVAKKMRMEMKEVGDRVEIIGGVHVGKKGVVERLTHGFVWVRCKNGEYFSAGVSNARLTEENHMENADAVGDIGFEGRQQLNLALKMMILVIKQKCANASQCNVRGYLRCVLEEFLGDWSSDMAE